MAIDIASLGTGEPVHIGHDPNDPLLANDSFKGQFQIAEDFEDDGTPINPADFTADGGWVGAITIEGTPFAASVSGFDAAGAYTLDIAESVSVVGTHRYNIVATNAVLSAQRTIQKGTIVISPRFAL
jgi:hypothetical protein